MDLLILIACQLYVDGKSQVEMEDHRALVE